MIEALRNNAYSLLERIPEENLGRLVEIMRCMCEPDGACGNSREFLRLRELCRPVEGLDDERELAEWREARFLR